MIDINEFIEYQLDVWPEAKGRYLDLGKTERRKFKVGAFEGAFQFNPARIRSTGARIDKESIGRRQCFLCAANRPEQQIAVPLYKGWELLLNPFPIFPVHFTIASTEHVPQDGPPIEMAAMVDSLPELALFFNGARAGASAPDHLHLQAVLKSELPMIALTEKYHTEDKKGVIRSDMYGVDLPFIYLSALITPDREGMEDYMQLLAMTGADPATGKPDKGLRNLICWKDDRGHLRMILIPRNAHRPSCYGDAEHNLMVSPGTIDMAGIVVMPRMEDFDRIAGDDIRKIYSECGIT